MQGCHIASAQVLINCLRSTAKSSNRERQITYIHVMQVMRLSGPAILFRSVRTASATAMHVATCMRTSVSLRHPTVGYMINPSSHAGTHMTVASLANTLLLKHTPCTYCQVCSFLDGLGLCLSEGTMQCGEFRHEGFILRMRNARYL